MRSASRAPKPGPCGPELRSGNGCRPVAVCRRVPVSRPSAESSGGFGAPAGLTGVDPGFSDASNIETVRIGIPNTQVSDPEKVIRMEEAILRKMETIAGVARVGAISALPFEADSTNPVYVDNEPPAEGKLPPLRRFKSITPGYLAAMGSRLVAGRDLSWTET